MSLTRGLHKVASPFLYESGLYRRLWQARNRNEPFSFVVIYHRVVADRVAAADAFEIEKGISAADFKRQMEFLLRHFTPVPASRIQPGSGKLIRFAVTLDDGYEDNYRVAAPILKKLGIPATFYVVSDFVGTDRLFWWEQVAEAMRASNRPQLDMHDVVPDLCRSGERGDIYPLGDPHRRKYAYEQLCARIRQGPHVDIPAHMDKIAQYFDAPLREEGRRYGLMDWRQLKELVAQGFEVGGHTATHCNVVGAGETLLQKELIDSIRQVEINVDAAVESFAYPYGLFAKSDQLVGKLIAGTNCKSAFTTERGIVTASSPAYELPRIHFNRSYRFACAFNLQEALGQGVY